VIVDGSRLGLLRWQLYLCWSLAEYHLSALTDELCRWEPAPGSWTVRRGADGQWRPDWVEPEPDPAPGVTVGWISWHIGWWWSATLDHAAGRTPQPRENVFWPGSAIEPFATFINTVPKYVATSTPLGRPWHNATAIEGGLVEFVQRLKQSPGGDIGVHASISVAQALLTADAIDEVRLVVAPAIAGRGRRLLDGPPPMRLELLCNATSSSGYLLADYRLSR